MADGTAVLFDMDGTLVDSDAVVARTWPRWSVRRVLVTISEADRAKPRPEGCLSAAAQLGVDPRRGLVVEDAVAGVLAGKAAGGVVAGLRIVPGADFNVAHLDELRTRSTRTPAGLRIRTGAGA